VSLAGAEPDNVLVLDARRARRSARSTARLDHEPCTRARSTRSRARPGRSSASTTRTAAPTRAGRERLLHRGRDRHRGARAAPRGERPSACAPDGLSDVQIWRGEVHVTTWRRVQEDPLLHARERGRGGHPPARRGAGDRGLRAHALAPEAAGAAARRGNRGAAWGGVGRLCGASRRSSCAAAPRDLGSRARCARRTSAPGAVLYDRVPGGVGLPVALFRSQRECRRAAHDGARALRVQHGCPACVGRSRRSGRSGRRPRSRCSPSSTTGRTSRLRPWNRRSAERSRP
jgi:hypothetical protein